MHVLGTLPANIGTSLIYLLPAVTSSTRLNHTNLGRRPHHAHEGEGLQPTGITYAVTLHTPSCKLEHNPKSCLIHNSRTRIMCVVLWCGVCRKLREGLGYNYNMASPIRFTI